MTRFLLLGLFGLTLPTLAHASSDDAWAEFRVEVKTACEALAPKDGTLLTEVNPFGSESYGAALVYHQTDLGLDRYICIFDKQSQKAELTGAFPVAGE